MLGLTLFILSVLILWGLIQWGDPSFVFMALTEFLIDACDD